MNALCRLHHCLILGGWLMSGAAAFSQQEIYFPASSAVGANDLITRIDFSAPGLGTGPVNLISGAAGITKPGAMVVDFSDGGSMFFADGLGADASIKTAGLGGPGAATTVVQLGVNVSSLALDRSGQIIYFTTSSAVAANNQIMRVSYEGTKLTVLFPASAGVTRPTALAVDVAAGIMFFADGVGPNTAIKAANLDTSGGITTLFNAGIEVSGLALDAANQRIYFTTASVIPANNRIMRLNYDGSGAAVLFSGLASLSHPNALALDLNLGKIYVADGNGADAIKMANLDGSGGISQVYPVGINPAGLALQFPPTVTGTVLNQPATDHSSLMPFASAVIGYFDPQQAIIDVSVQMDDPNKGSFTVLNGFTLLSAGDYYFSGSLAAANSALEGLVFTPAMGRVPPGSTETTLLTLVLDDGFAVTVDRTTSVLTTDLSSPPVANPDFFARQPNQPLIIPVSQVLANDTDPNGDVLTVQSVDSTSARGVPVSFSGANIIYAASGSLPPDTFHYVIADTQGAAATGLVTITTAFAGILLQAGNLALQFTEIPNLTYRIQFATDLASPNWITLATVMADANGQFSYTDVAPTDGTRFYRAISP